MKKSRLIIGSLYALFGIACLSIALLTESKVEGILWGFAGAGIGPGIMMILQYFYWSSPRNSVRYEARLENERIEMHDELKTKVRNEAGRYAFSAVPWYQPPCDKRQYHKRQGKASEKHGFPQTALLFETTAHKT